MRILTFHDHNTVRADFLEEGLPVWDGFWQRHTEFVVINETLGNFYASYSCDFKVYMKDKPGNYGLLFRLLAYTQDGYASRVIPYVNPPINNSEKKGDIQDLVMETSKDIFNTGRNVTGDRLYSVIDTVEELYQKKTTYVGTIMPNRKDHPVALKTAKGREVLSSNLHGKIIAQL